MIFKRIKAKLARMGLMNMPDEQFLKLIFSIAMDYELNLENPLTFNEKLQWLKIHDRKSEYTKMVDKFDVKQFVTETIGSDYIIPTIGVYEKFEDINFDELPNQFVVKCTHDSGGLIVCRNKSSFDKTAAKKKINKCLKRNFYNENREWPYKDVKPRIIVEKYMEDKNSGKELKDYKFYCFHGEPRYLYVSEGLEDHSTARIGFFDMEFKPAPFGRTDFKRFEIPPLPPKNFEKMKEIARVLSRNNVFLRVDLYEINDRIYFGELTFTPCAGYMPFDPPEWDRKLGDLIDLTKVRKNEK